MIFETNRSWGMAAIFYSVFAKGKQFGAVQLLFYMVEKADVSPQGCIHSKGDMNDR